MEAEKWLLSTSCESEVEEDEALSLSLSNLPKEQTQSIQESPSASTQEDFDFGSTLFNKTEMCSADELFFQGSILPVFNFNKDPTVSSSESIKPGRNSRGSSSSTTQIEKSRKCYYFHSNHHHPSPKPQIRYSRIKNQNSKSTMWSHFRVGLLTTPEIELEDLKVRSTRRNRSSSTSSSDNGTNSGNSRGGKSDKKKKQGLLDITGCKCSVNVEIVQSKVVKGRRQRSNKQRKEV